MKPTILIAVAATIVAVNLASAQESKLPAASTKENITYATDIKPIFDTSCVKCHSGDKAKARLHMDTLEGVLKGTKQGKVVVAGEAEKSVLVKAVTHQMKDHDGWMPPIPNRAGIKPLTTDEIALIIGWVKQGAK